MGIEDKAKPDAKVPVDTAVDALTGQWKEVMNGKQLYSQWFDNHDGYGSAGFDVGNAIHDGLQMQVNHDDIAHFPAAVVRTRIPGTAWTVETAGVYRLEDAQRLEK